MNTTRDAFVCCCLLSSFVLAGPLTVRSQESQAKLYVNAESAVMREKSDQKGKVVAPLDLGDEVQVLGEKSKDEVTVRLRCKDVRGHFIKVKRSSDSKIGWVFGGVLQKTKPPIPPKTWRAVIAILDDPESASEDWNYFGDDIRQACEKAGNYFAWAFGNEPCARLGPDDSPISVMDMTETIEKKRKGWVLVEKKANEKTSEFLRYDITTKEQAEAFCRNK